jgi:hypothetical protein
MQVLFLNPLEERLRDFPNRFLPTPDFEVRLPEADGALPPAVEQVEACVYWDHPVGRELLNRLPALRFIQRVAAIGQRATFRSPSTAESWSRPRPMEYWRGWRSTRSC